jgi:hypothetical protein
MTAFANILPTLNAATLALLGNYTATFSGGSAVGLLGDAYAEFPGGMVSGSAPEFTCASADVASLVEGSAITINAVNYTVAAIKPDGNGFTRLLLEKA